MANYSGLRAPSISAPSLSVPKLSSVAPKAQYKIPNATEIVPRLFGPGTYIAPTTRRHVENLGDVLLGGPLGTLQLEHTLEDNNLGQYSQVPILNKLLGIGLLFKERTLEPIQENNVKVALINNLQSIGQDLDILSNPVKSLLHIADGGGNDDFLKSMGWIGGKYRKLYQWNSGSWIVDILGETVSDPITWITLGSSTALKQGAEVGAEQILKNVEKVYGKEVAEGLTKRKIIALINKYGTDLTEDQILQLIKKEADIAASSIKRSLIEIQEVTSPEYIRLKELLKKYNAISTGVNESDFIDLVSKMRFSDAYKQYAAIRNVVNKVDKVQNAWTNALYAVNPLLGTPAFLIKSENVRNYVKSIANNMFTTKDKITQGDVFKLREATVIAEQKGMELFTGAYSNDAWFEPVKQTLAKHNMDYKDLTHLYMQVVDTLNPIDRADDALVNKRFLDKLLMVVPELRHYSEVELLNQGSDFLTEMFNAVVQQAKSTRDIIEHSIAIEKTVSNELTKDVLNAKQIVDTIHNTEKNINNIIIDDGALLAYGERLEEMYQTELQNYERLKNISPALMDEDTLVLAGKRFRQVEDNLNKIKGLLDGTVEVSLTDLPDRLDVLRYLLSDDALDKIEQELVAIGISQNNLVNVSKLYKSYLDGDAKALNSLRDVLDITLTDNIDAVKLPYSPNKSDINDVLDYITRDAQDTEAMDQALMAEIYNKRVNKKELDAVYNARKELEETCDYWIDLDTQIKDLLNNWNSLNGLDNEASLNTLYTALNDVFNYAGQDEDYNPIKLISNLFSKDWSEEFRNLIYYVNDPKHNDYINTIHDIQSLIDRWKATASRSNSVYADTVSLFLTDLKEIIKEAPTTIDYQKHLKAITEEGDLYTFIVTALGRVRIMLNTVSTALSDTAFAKDFKELINPNSDLRKTIYKIVKLVNEDPSGMAINKNFSRHITNLIGMVDGTYNLMLLDSNLKSLIDNLAKEYADIVPLTAKNKQYLQNLLLDTMLNNQNKYIVDVTQTDLISQAMQQFNFNPDNSITKALSRDINELIEEQHLAKDIMEVYDADELATRLDALTDEIGARLAGFPSAVADVYRTVLNDYYTRQLNITFNGSAPLLFTFLGAPNRQFNAINTANELARNYKDLLKFCETHANDLTSKDIDNFKDVIFMFAQERVANEYIKDAQEFARAATILDNATLESSRTIERKYNESINRIMTTMFNRINTLNLQYNGAQELINAYGVKIPLNAGQTVRVKNVVNYLTRDNVRQILYNMSGESNLVDAMITLGDYGIGVKRVRDYNFLFKHNLTAEKLKVTADYLNVVSSLSVYIRRYQDIAEHANARYMQKLRDILTEFFTTYNKDYGPIDPVNYFNNASNADLLAWNSFCKRRFFDRSGSAHYKKIYDAQLSALNKNLTRSDYVYNAVSLAESLDTALQNGIYTDPKIYEDLLTHNALSEAGVDLDDLNTTSIVDEVLDLDLSRLPKSIETLNDYNSVIQKYIDEDITARRVISPAEKLILESDKTLKDYVDPDKFPVLNALHISEDTPIKSKTVSTLLKNERMNNFHKFLMSLEPAQMHKFMLDNNIPVMFYAAKELPLNVEPSLLKKAGLSMVKIYPDDDIYLIVALPKGATKSYKYTRTPYLVNEIQAAYNKAFKANALYYNMNDLNIPVDYFTGDMLDIEVYKNLFNDPKVFEAVQKSYPNITEKELNKFFEKSPLRPNYIILGEPQAFNKVISKTGAAKSARYKDAGLLQSAKLGTISSIKRVNARNKYLTLIFNDDFSFNGAFKNVFNGASDAQIKDFFKQGNYTAVILRKNKQGEPWLYKINIFDKKSLDVAKKANAVILPNTVYRNALLTINQKKLTGKYWNLYNHVIAATYKTLYLTTPGFLMRNYLDSAVIKNNIAMGGNLDNIWPNFKYEFKAMKMLQEYDNIMAEAIELARKQNNGTKFNRRIINNVLKTKPNEVVTRFKLVDSFISTPASAGLTRSLSDYLLDYNLHHSESNIFAFEKWWNDHLSNVPIIKIVRDVNDTIEQSSRLGLFLNLLDNGNEYTEAIAKVVNTHFDYELKRGGLELLDQIFWFSTFPINNLLFYLNQDAMFTNPIIKLQFDMLEQSYNNDDISWDDVRHSDYLTYNALAGNITYKSWISGNRIVLKTGSSVMDFFNILANPFGEAKERINPFLSVVLGIDELDQLNPASMQLSNIDKIRTGKSYLPSVYAKLYKQRRGNIIRYNRLKRPANGSWNSKFRPRRLRPTYLPSNKALAYRHRYYDKYFNSHPLQFHKFHPKFYTYDPMYKSFYINKQLNRWTRQSKKVI